MADRTRRVAIVGGGFSGAMLAARLAERGVASILIDRTGAFGLGVAWSTPFDGHLLNVRSDRMSAIEGRPDDFVAWLEACAGRPAEPDGFAPRRVYGQYLQDRFDTVRSAVPPGMMDTVTGEAVAIEGSRVRLADGRRIEADAVVLASGNPAPGTTGAFNGAGTGRVIPDPWAAGAVERIGADDDVILIGTGLTMVDMMLALKARGWRGRATAVSRRGLTPRAHGAVHEAGVSPTREMLSGPPSRRLRAARRLAEAQGWRPVMEGLRPLTADLWREADAATRSRWLRHLRPWWDVHRHRIPVGIAATMDALMAEGRLRVVAGRVQRIHEGADGVQLDWNQRGGGEGEPLTGGWLIDCSGPGHDVAAHPLTRALIASGRARPDALGLGLELDADGRVLGADGASDPGLFVLGPPARAAFWETVAVPDIRKRIEDMVERLAALQASASR